MDKNGGCHFGLFFKVTKEHLKEIGLKKPITLYMKKKN